MPHIRPLTLLTSSLRKACTAPGTSSQLSTSASSRVAASLQKHSQRIRTARQQAVKPSCRPKPSQATFVAARQPPKPIVSSSSLSSSLSPSSSSSSFASSVSSFQGLPKDFHALSLCPRTRILPEPLPRIPGSRIPIFTGRRPATSRRLPSCIRNTALGRPSKRVHFANDLMTIAEIRFYKPVLGPEDFCLPFIRNPTGDLPNVCHHTNIPNIEGPTYPTRISRIPTLHGITLGKQFQLRHDGFYLAPSREGSKGPDGQLRRCPYCMFNASVGGWVPPFPQDLETISAHDYGCHWFQEAQKLNCEDHEE